MLITYRCGGSKSSINIYNLRCVCTCILVKQVLMLEILLHTNTMVCQLLQAIVSGLNQELPGGGGGEARGVVLNFDYLRGTVFIQVIIACNHYT